MNKQVFSDNKVQVFFNNFSSAEEVFETYCAPMEWRDGLTFVYADYETPGYEGNSFVVFVKDGKLYEVNGSHCSCNGLEESWRPEETSFAALMFRPNVPDQAKKNLKLLYPVAAFL